jgi:hypothetical protein
MMTISAPVEDWSTRMILAANLARTGFLVTKLETYLHMLRPQYALGACSISEHGRFGQVVKSILESFRDFMEASAIAPSPDLCNHMLADNMCTGRSQHPTYLKLITFSYEEI